MYFGAALSALLLAWSTVATTKPWPAGQGCGTATPIVKANLFRFIVHTLRAGAVRSTVHVLVKLGIRQITACAKLRY